MTDSASSPQPWIDLNGRVALVTGAASGIGNATAIALASAGAIVIATDQSLPGAKATAATIASAGGTVHARELDVTSEAAWEDTAQWVEQQFGRLDILVNSAGVALSDRVGDSSLEVYRKTFAINIEGTLLGMAVALRFMRRAGSGVITNLASAASFRGNPKMASYGASKAAVAHFTRSAALESVRAGHDIRINALHPGLVATSMAKDFYGIFEQLGSPDDVISTFTTGRPGRPEEIADLILFLSSDRATFISGASITIDRAHSA
jgi:NAD(P)-dependent dehydrogenase (short-subunit alcohol dehydrogenase family)